MTLDELRAEKKRHEKGECGHTDKHICDDDELLAADMLISALEAELARLRRIEAKARALFEGRSTNQIAFCEEGIDRMAALKRALDPSENPQ